MKPKNILFRALSIGSVSALAMTSGLTAAHAKDVRSFNIPSGQLKTAIKAFINQSGQQMIYKTSDLKNIRTKGLSGSYAPKQALAHLLKGTNVNVRWDKSGAAVLYMNNSSNTRYSAASFLTNVDGALQDRNDSTTSSIRTNQVDGSEVEIVVIGRALDQAIAIEAKRNAKQIIDVISADTANKLPDNNVAESLRRIPGVNVGRNSQTGDGDLINIRGLDSALVNIQFDGINAATSETDTRSIALNGVSADNVSEIRVAKSLSARDESEGIGGSVNIISKTPLQVGKDVYTFDVSGRYGEYSNKLGGDIAASLNKILTDNLAIRLSGEYRVRNIRNLKVSAASPHIDGLRGIDDANGNFIDAQALLDLGLDDAGTHYDSIPRGLISPDLIVFEDVSYSLEQQRRKTLSLSGAIDWRISDSTILTLGGRHSQETTRGSVSDLEFGTSDGDFILDGDVLRTNFTSPVVEYQARIEDRTLKDSVAFLKGVTETDKMKLEYSAFYSRATRDSPRTSLSFDTSGLTRPDSNIFAPFDVNDRFFGSPNPNAAVGAEGVTLIEEFGSTVTNFADRLGVDAVNTSFPSGNKSEKYGARFDFTFEIDRDSFSQSISFGGKYDRSDRSALILSNSRENDANDYNIDGTYVPDNGGNIQTFNAGNVDPDLPNEATLSQLDGGAGGLFGGFNNRVLDSVGSPLSSIGLNGFPFLNDDSFRAFSDNIINSYAGEFSRGVSDSTEETFAGYFQSELDFGRLQLIPGLRVDHYRGEFVQSISLDAEINFDANGDTRDDIDLVAPDFFALQSTSSQNTSILPRLNGRYEITDKLQLRFGAGTSIARPSFRQLGRAAVLALDFDIDEIVLPGVTTAAGLVAAGGLTPADIGDLDIRITNGNPNLKNATSRNLDLSLEYYPMPGTAISLGLFHKRIKNFIFIGEETGVGGFNTTLFDRAISTEGRALIDGLGGLDAILAGAPVKANGSPADIRIEVPQNGDVATVQGLELGISHRFNYLPGLLSNFGMSANFTYTDSDAELEGDTADLAAVALGFAEAGEVLVQNVSFGGAPEISANGLLYYQDKSFDIALSASYTSETFNGLTDYGFSRFIDQKFQLDLFAAYTLPDIGFLNSARVFVEIPDFLDGGRRATESTLVGSGGAIDGADFNGREIRFGFRTTF